MFREARNRRVARRTECLRMPGIDIRALDYDRHDPKSRVRFGVTGFDPPMANAFFSDLLSTISERGRTLLRRGDRSDAGRTPPNCSNYARRCCRAAAKPPAPRWRARCSTAITTSTPPAGLPSSRRWRATSAPTASRLSQAIETWRAQAERRRRQRPAFRLRAAAAGTDPPAQPRAGRHQRTGGDARRSAFADEGQQGSGSARPRRRASAVVLVQQGISRAAQDRLVDASQHSGTDHPLRGGARDPRLGRSAPPHRPGRPPLLRLFPSRNWSTSR